MKTFLSGKRRILLSGIVLSNMAYAGTNTVELKRIANDFKNIETLEKSEAVAFATQNQLPIREVTSTGQIIEIQKIVDGIPMYYITENSDAAISTRTDKVWTGPYGVTGSGYSKLGEWDGGGIRLSHHELAGRVTQKDSPSSASNHSTHVAGTMIASGIVAQAKGMAYEATLDAYDWNSAESEMATAAANGLEISNHSYGYITGWYSNNWYGYTSISQNEAFYFGFYSSASKDWDNIAYNAPNYLIVKSAGNDRSNDAPALGTVHSHNGSGSYTDTHYDDGYDNGGYDTVGTQGVAKNILTVGAVYDVPSYTSPTSVTMSSFSGWGPVDDGRIKPDIVGNGIGLYSSLASGDGNYGSYSGTSMASPNVAGSLALLQQLYQNEHEGTPMRSATLKALVLHTADEAGVNAGPDYQFGWGLLNVEKAADVIKRDKTEDLIVEETLKNADTYMKNITLKGQSLDSLKVTLVWTDPAGTPVAASLDPTDKMLVNDLDLRIVKDGMTYYPWKLNRNDPSAAATRSSKNDVDNVEQVVIDAPTEGRYTIIVDCANRLPADQDFSIVVSTGGYTKNDFNGDGRADILWGDNDFKFRIWNMSENGKVGSHWIGEKMWWQVEAIDDFNGDGYADILWENGNGDTPSYTIWLMDKNGKMGTVWLGYHDWTIEKTGDIDGDGKADILWRKDYSSGHAFTVWLMDENGKRGTTWIGSKEDWTVKGMADFDGDGKSDILWKRADGKHVVWLMDENGKRGAIQLGNKKWTVEQVGDIDGDGKADIVWDKGGDTYTVWLMAETGKKGTVWIGTKSNWKVKDLNDFNGDGYADILWEKPNGKFTIWLMDGNGKKGTVWIGDKPWVVQPGWLDGPA